VTRLYHVTLTSGHHRWSPRADVDDAVIAGLAPLVAGAEAGVPQLIARPGGTGWISLRRLDPGAAGSRHVAAWSLDDGDNPARPSLVTVALAMAARPGNGLWRTLHAQLGLTPPGFRTRADQPAPFPWLAAAVHLPLALHPDAKALAAELGDLERCIAWTWIETVYRGGDRG
jgi:hypothetical protein